MATYDELMRSALNAHNAGDTSAAKKLYDYAQTLVPADDTPVEPGGDPRAYDVTETTPKKPDRFGDTIKYVTKEPIDNLKAITKGIANPSQSVTQTMLPDGMNPQLKQRLGFIGDVALTGLSGLGVGASATAGLIGETLGGTPNNERRLARDLLAASEVMIPEMAGPGLALQVTPKSIKKAINANTVKARAAQAADDLDITPSLGMGGKVRGMTAAGLEKVPLTGGVIGRDAARAASEIETAFHKITGSIGSAKTSDRAGEVLQSGLAGFVTKVKDKANILYGKVGEKLPPETKIDLNSTAETIGEAKAAFEGNEALAKKLGLNDWDRVIQEASENGLSWAAATEFRSTIGAAIGKLNGPLADQSAARLKKLYGALTDDMAAAAKANGASAEWNRAASYYKASATRIEKQLDKAITAKTPERAFEIFVSATKGDRATSDLNRLRAIKKSMEPEEWGDVSASIIDRLGKAKAGAQNADGDAFSASTFLTEWNKLSPEGKRLLVPETARIELEKLALVAEKAKAASIERNVSNTGTPFGLMLAGGGLAVSPAAAGAAIGGSFLSAKAMTSTFFLRALNSAAKGDTKALTAMSKGHGPFKQDAAAILRMSAAEAAAGNAANDPRQPQQAVGN